MSTGYGWEGLRQVRATLLGACLSAPAKALSILTGAITKCVYLYLCLPFVIYDTETLGSVL